MPWIWTGIQESETAQGLGFYYLLARAPLLRARGDATVALEAARTAGERFASHGCENPAFVPWRNEVAQCLYDLGMSDEAIAAVKQDHGIAVRWGAAGTIAGALRTLGLIRGSEEGLALLNESVSTLGSGSAHLEHGKSLVALGGAQSRDNQRTEAKDRLIRGVQLAERCGAAPLSQQGIAELRILGANPRRLSVKDPGALTPRELRVAGLAAEGQSNRQIAQSFFTTIETVEVDLDASYRKLGIRGRSGLAKALQT